MTHVDESEILHKYFLSHVGLLLSLCLIPLSVYLITALLII